MKTTTSSTRFRNSGRKCFLSSDMTRLSISWSERPLAPWAEKPMVEVWAMSRAPMLDVMMMTVLEKSTWRPWPSVRRPSSRIWSRTLKTSGCAFSTSSKRTTEYGRPADGLGELAALVVAHVARGRADELGDGVLLHELGHVEGDERLLGTKEELGRAPWRARSCPRPRAEEDERAAGATRVLERAAAAPDGLGDLGDRLVLADDALVEHVLGAQELDASASVRLETGTPVMAETTSAMSCSSTVTTLAASSSRQACSSSSRRG